MNKNDLVEQTRMALIDIRANNNKESQLGEGEIWEARSSSTKIRQMQNAVHDFMVQYDLVRRHPQLIEDGQFTKVFRAHKEALRVAADNL